MKDYSNYVNANRSSKSIKFYIHKKCESEDIFNIFCTMPYMSDKWKSDGIARIIACTDRTVAYRTNNDVFIIPATIKAVINNDGKTIECYFDYPCEMKREDLVEY